MSGPDISIEHKPTFQAVLNKLTELNNDLEQKLKGSSDVIEKVKAAASENVVYPGSDGKVAAAYTGSVTALDAATQNISNQVKSARTAVSTAISELQTLLDGMTHIDNTSAADIKNVG